MEELVLFKKRVASLIDRAYDGGVTLLPFLDEAMEGVLLDYVKKSPGIYHISSGGIIDSDRKRHVLSLYDMPDFDFRIVIFKLLYNKRYYEINHRSVLGSLMALGIKRECIGDIVITDDKDVYVAVTEEMSEFVRTNLTGVGRAVVECVRYDGEVKNIIRYESKLHFLSSMRLDVVIAAAYNLSRNEALETIMSGLVYVNQILNQNPSHLVKINDIISVRHKGKLLVSSSDGKTRSDRLKVELKKRC